MLQPLIRPQSAYVPPALPDLSDKTVRGEMTDGALRAFFNIMEAWSVRDSDARSLLGGVSNGNYYAMKKGNAAPLDADRLSRISALVGIFKSLNILHGQELADRWMTMPNRNRLFGGATPVAYLAKGGLPAFETLKRFLDARRGGR